MQKSVVFPVQELLQHRIFSSWLEKKRFHTKTCNFIYIFSIWKRVCTRWLTSRMEPVIESESENGLQWHLPWRMWQRCCLLAHDKWETVIEDVSLIHHNWFNRSRCTGQFHSRKKKLHPLSYLQRFNASWSNHVSKAQRCPPLINAPPHYLDSQLCSFREKLRDKKVPKSQLVTSVLPCCSEVGSRS